jgi:dsDNA-specific endonuclease/ATPase MutS2
MNSPAVGDLVHTPLGKGVIREIRGRRFVVTIGARAVVVDAGDVTLPLPDRKAKKTSRRAPVSATGDVNAESERGQGAASIDLHGCTVDEALERALSAIDAAIRDGYAELRVIHGRSGGRIRAALHARLRQLPSIRVFRLDPANPGVTIVTF